MKLNKAEMEYLHALLNVAANSVDGYDTILELAVAESPFGLDIDNVETVDSKLWDKVRKELDII